MVYEDLKTRHYYKEFGGHKYELHGYYTNKKDADSLAKAWRDTGKDTFARVERTTNDGKPLYLVWMYRKPRRM